MSNTVTIVTAFVDIGRGEWTGYKNNELIPNFIKRDTETYLKRFERLTKLKNPIVCFTESKFFDRIKAMRDDIVLIGIDTVFEDHKHLTEAIEHIQQEPAFIKFVNNKSSPERWSPEYVAINLMKSFFVTYAVENKLAPSNTYAWIDFGYVRDDTICPPGLEWKFETNNKINLFTVNQYTHGTPIFEVVRTGEVFIQGCHIVAPANKWRYLKDLMSSSLSILLSTGLIDDDQTMLLMAYRSNPNEFILHHVGDANWFVIFEKYHHD